MYHTIYCIIYIHICIGLAVRVSGHPVENHAFSESFLLFQILTPFLLRRLKSDVALEVPPKKEIIVYAPLTAKQEALYTAVVNNTISKLLGVEKVMPCNSR